MEKTLLAEQLQADRDCSYRIWEDYHRKMLGASGKQEKYFRDWVNFYDTRVRALDYAMEALRKHDII